MRYPWANVVLLILLIFQLVTGFLGLISGSENLRWILWLHGAGGYAIAAISFWKGIIIFDVFNRIRRINLSRLVFIVLAGLLATILATGLIWAFAGRMILFGMSLMTIHALASIALVAFLVWHSIAKRFILRAPEARGRRAFLRLAANSLTGLVVWGFVEPLKKAFGLPGAARRFTGSYEASHLTGDFPQVIWLFDNVQPIDLNHWRLIVDGQVEQVVALTLEQLGRLASDRSTETIDCTGGWYSTQEWIGVNLGRLLDMAGVKPSARSVTVEAVSGYARRFALQDARGYLLSTRVAGQPLSHGHGFPLRLVASGHRGFDWVKWVGHIRVNETSHFLQPPVPLQ